MEGGSALCFLRTVMAAHTIHAMFPNIDNSVIDSVLEASGHDAEAAVETLLTMGAVDGFDVPPAAPGMGSNSSSSSTQLPNLSDPQIAEQQIADDEALARQLQQQLIWEEDYHHQQLQEQQQLVRQQHAGLTYPGAAPYGENYAAAATRGRGAPPAAIDPEEDTLSLGSLGSAVYSAGAATASAAGSVLSGLWSWATEADEEPTAAGRSGGREAGREARRDGSPAPIELQEVRGGTGRESQEEVETQVVGCGDAERCESGQGCAVRRRAAGSRGSSASTAGGWAD